ncbi:DUF6327 family protein [Tamlana crocina]|uniref:Glutaminyl-tRNA synthetase n=1 Tax=Tamlana crocina TaxID=393006 RepID=A0ABX1DE71_9FLAO|nr:DUF6327 family protein [Tamlana crocina]NJX16009.1 hypothetical protein [Tamlana crocina]
MKIYRDSKSIERDLKILNLERQIAWEEMKNIKEEYKESLRPLNWIQSGLKLMGKYGGFMLLKKMMK